MKRALLLLAACTALLLLEGCASFDSLPSPFRRTPPRPGRTSLGSQLVIVPTKAIGNVLIVEAKGDRFGPYHFLVDTGSSVTLVTPEIARRSPGRGFPCPPGGP